MFDDTKLIRAAQLFAGGAKSNTPVMDTIFANACGLKNLTATGAQDFYNWCRSVELDGKPYNTKCENVNGVSGFCNATIQFKNLPIKFLATEIVGRAENKTTTTTKAPYNGGRPPGSGVMMKYYHNCDFGIGKPVVPFYKEEKMDYQKFEDTKLWCDQQINGIRGMNLWILLLIVLMILIGLGIAAALFWRFFLRRRLGYGPAANGGAASTFDSRWSSAAPSSYAASTIRQPSGRASSAARSYSSSGGRSRAPSSLRPPSGTVQVVINSPSASRVKAPSIATRVTSQGSAYPSGSRLPSAPSRSYTNPPVSMRSSSSSRRRR